MSNEAETQRRFTQIDVFTDAAFCGNPLAVVVDGDGVTAEQMLRFANWTNLSETTFLLSPTDPAADYRVRIFTPVGELPFAGHPTLGTCRAWLESGGRPADPNRIVQQCEAGLIAIRRDGARLAFAAPPLRRSGPVDDELAAGLAMTLGVERSALLDCEWIDNGPGWVGVLLADAQAVLALKPSYSDLAVGVVGAHPAGSAHAIEVRAFFPKDGVTMEDPVTGSLNASIAQWLLRTDRLQSPYVASQGSALGRAGRVHVTAEDGEIWVGGDTVVCIDGTVTI
jgi:PhzF family phenazine biosynthesis protein